MCAYLRLYLLSYFSYNMHSRMILECSAFLKSVSRVSLVKKKDISMDYYYNCEPGRLRIRTPYLYQNPPNAAVFEKNLKELSGIVSVETNPLTGSALIHFDE